MNESPKEIGLRDLWVILYGQRILIAAVTGACVVASLALAFFMTSVYRADVLVAPTAEKSDVQNLVTSPLGGLAALGGLSLGGGGKKDEGVATLKSRVLIDALVSDRKLLPVLFASQWDRDEARWKVEGERVPTLRDAHKLFAGEILEVSEDRKTGLILVAVEWKDPQQAADWANDLIARTNALLRERAVTRSERNLAFLQGQLKATSSVEVREALYRLIESEMKSAMLAEGSREFVFKVIDPAVVPEDRSRPKRGLIVMVGLVIGLSLGVLGALLRGGPARAN
jgi:uncharacterized protein involved in exopolysaccharide biosynthesis